MQYKGEDTFAALYVNTHIDIREKENSLKMDFNKI